MAAKISRFAGYELDRTAFQLRHNGRPVHLERIPLELLFLLAERSGQLVTRGKSLSTGATLSVTLKERWR
jgi:DNA-binding response OmpR family regulator